MLHLVENGKYTVFGNAWLLFFSTTSFFAYIQSFFSIPLNYPVAFMLGIVFYFYYLKYEDVSVKYIVINIFAICICIAIATLLHDFSWDGQAYHMEAVWQLVNGWNIYHSMPLTDDNTINSIWLNSYPKATWMFGAALYAVTGSLLSCKSYMFILCIANAFLLHNTVRNYVDNKWFARGIILSLIANPVVCAQIWSTYLDGALYLICLAISALLINAVNNEYRVDCLLLAVLSSSIALNFKFTAVAYVGLIWLCFMTYILVTNRSVLTQSIIATFISLFLGLLVIGYNPYVTNLVREGHPFWPVRGTHDLQNVMLSCGNEEFIEQNRFVKIGESYFGKSSNQIASIEKVEYKIPFTVSKSEITNVIAYDCRIGGMGVWFSGVIILAFIALIIIYRYHGRYGKGNACILSFIVLSIIINPESWVARYAPQIYVVPIIILTILNRIDDLNIKRFSNFMLIIIIINTMIVFGGRTTLQCFNEYSDYKSFSEMKKKQPVKVWSSGMFDTILESRFKYYKVDYNKNEFINKASDMQIKGVGGADEHIRIWTNE